jgi:hypothetical protein
VIVEEGDGNRNGEGDGNDKDVDDGNKKGDGEDVVVENWD